MKRKYNKINVEFGQSEILFPNGYFFRQSSIDKKRKIEFEKISEVNLNTFPPSLIFQDNEIIFIKQEFKSEFEQFALRNGIPIVERFDIWEHINRPYLDTEFEKNEKKESIRLLSENGISESELSKIRKKVIKTMFINFLVWEWVYLGLFHYLSWTFLTEKKYWWSMNIALRNYNKNVAQQHV